MRESAPVRGRVATAASIYAGSVRLWEVKVLETSSKKMAKLLRHCGMLQYSSMLICVVRVSFSVADGPLRGASKKETHERRTARRDIISVPRARGRCGRLAWHVLRGLLASAVCVGVHLRMKQVSSCFRVILQVCGISEGSATGCVSRHVCSYCQNTRYMGSHC